MKRLTYLLITLFTLQVVAGDKQFNNSMQALIEKSASVQESTEYQQLADEFAELAREYPKEWLPLYYAGYYYTNAAAKNNEPQKKVSLYDKADDFIAKGLNRAPEQSEFFALRAYIIDKKQKTAAKINTDEWLARFNRNIEMAKKYGPNNPRAYLVSAMHLVYRPGKLDEAKTDADRAVLLYNNETANLHPDWGKDLAIGLSKKLQNN